MVAAVEFKNDLCSHLNQDLVLDWHPIYEVRRDEKGEVISSKVLMLKERNWKCSDCGGQISQVEML